MAIKKHEREYEPRPNTFEGWWDNVGHRTERNFLKEDDYDFVLRVAREAYLAGRADEAGSK